MNALVNSFSKPLPSKMTQTENQAVTHASTGSAVLDFFAKSGALRGRPEDFVRLFSKAFNEDPQLALRALYNARDIRQGKAERENFRQAMVALAEFSEEAWFQNALYYVPEYGRWDDLWPLLNTSALETVLRITAQQLAEDSDSLSKGGPVSLLGKWLPRENTSSQATRAKARLLIEKLGMTPRHYRKLSVALTARAKVLEPLISSNRWEEVDYSKVPSQAMKKYRKAFYRRDEARFVTYLGAVEKGEAKISAGTLTPVDIVAKYGVPVYSRPVDPVLEALWEALPGDFGEGSILAVADTSGSMSGLPMQTAVALAIFTAQRNRGPFAGYWLNFSRRPTWQTLVGKTLREIISNIDFRNWHQNTDLQAVFDLILKKAVASRCPQEDMPKLVAIISDMQFDRTNASGYGVTDAEQVRIKYRNAGYDMPTLMWWNVRASHGQPVTQHELGMILESGASQSALQAVMDGNLEVVTPMEHMLSVLNGGRYDPLEIS